MNVHKNVSLSPVGSHLENKEELIVTGVQILLSEQNLKVNTNLSYLG